MLQLCCAPFAMNWYVLKCPIYHWYAPNYSVLHLLWTDMFWNVLSAIDMFQLLYAPFVMDQICFWMTWYVWFGIYWDGILENSCILPCIMIPYSFQTVPFVLNMLCHLLSRFWLTLLLYKPFRSACHSSRCLIWAEAVDSYSELWASPVGCYAIVV